MFILLLNKGKLNDVDLFILIFIMIVIHVGDVYLISKQKGAVDTKSLKTTTLN